MACSVASGAVHEACPSITNKAPPTAAASIEHGPDSSTNFSAYAGIPQAPGERLIFRSRTLIMMDAKTLTPAQANARKIHIPGFKENAPRPRYSQSKIRS